ncbi:MAG: hypothetical protein JWP59_4124 [Massilia sp.]|nr:hypothetical protein [Massilia sp.]
MSIRFLFSTIAALCIAVPAHAAEAPVRVQQEVTYLLDAVGSSQCQFNRNGAWYEGEQARAHLRKKFDYLAKKNMVATTENFIERAATSSSTSGKNYQIRCPGAAPVDSAVWLQERLASLRRQGR